MGITVAGQSSSVYLLPGMSIKAKVSHFFAKSGEVLHKYKDGTLSKVSLINGFVLDDTSVGEISAGGDGLVVIYKHKKFEANTLTFYALTGERGRVEVMSVPVHDHSSIVAGGPAYGTYFSDDETVSDEGE